MIPRRCPLCRTSERSREYAKEAFDLEHLGEFAYASRKVPEYMHYRLLLCDGCGILYASPIPEDGELISEYQVAAYDSGREAEYAAQTYARLLVPILDRLPNRTRALDIGAGDGAFVKKLLAAGFTDVVGVEPSAAPIQAAEPRVRAFLRQAPFRRKDFEEERFSLITCFQTLEHVADPLQLCLDAYSLLESGGSMFCVVHNRLALSARLLGRRSPIFDIEHSATLLSAKCAASSCTRRLFRYSRGWNSESLSADLLAQAFPIARNRKAQGGPNVCCSRRQSSPFNFACGKHWACRVQANMNCPDKLY